jgi:hypothetical protein
VLRNASTRQTAIYYLNNNVLIGAAYGPTLSTGWGLEGVADFNRDSHSDYALFAAGTRQTGIYYLNNSVYIGSTYGPSLPAGWELVTTADFNADGYPDYVLYKASTHQTAIYYLNNNVLIGAAYGPTLPRLAGDWRESCTWRWAAVCDAFRFLPVRVHGKYTKHLVSIRISTHSDKMRIGDIPTRSTLSPRRLLDGCAEV